MVWTVCSFLLFTALVGIISYYRTRNEDLSSREGYFLAGRGLSGWVIAGSMLLTNLSAEHMVGLNGQAYRYNLSGMAWETTAAVATVVMALYFLPRYLRGAFTTLPEFFEARFDEGTRRMMSVLLLVGYVAITVPAGVLYPGAVALNKIFDISSVLGVSHWTGVWVSVWIIGLVGAAYAIFGGLKAVAVSDSINGIGLLIGGLLVPVFGLIALGDGSLSDGAVKLINHAPEKLNAIGAATDPVPFGTIFTGMVFANLFYWGTNQAVIQRSLGAKNLAEGQKGVLISGMIKIFVPMIMMVPGLIAFQLFPDLTSHDLAYPTLVAATFPKALLGFFTAVLMGAVLSTFNSLLNSAATIFCLDIYKPIFNPDVDDATLIRRGKLAAALVALATMAVAPFVYYAPDGLYQFIRRSTGFYNIPMIALVLVGFFTRHTSGLAARVAVGLYIVSYTLLVFVFDEPLHFIHIMGLLFAGMVLVMLAVSHFRPRAEAYHPRRSSASVDLTPWRYGPFLALGILAVLVMVYLFCSPLGLASPSGFGWSFATSSLAVGFVVLVCAAALLRRDRRIAAAGLQSPSRVISSPLAAGVDEETKSGPDSTTSNAA